MKTVLSSKWVSRAAVCGSLALCAMTSSADTTIASTVSIYQSTTWTAPVSYAVVRQGNHADLYNCPNNAVFSGDASNAAQIQAFVAASCPNVMQTGVDSHASYTGFTNKVYVPTGAAQPTQAILTTAYSVPKPDGSFSDGLQTFTIDLDISANPAASTLLEQGVSTKYQNSDNPVLNSFKQTFVFVGSAPVDAKPIVN